MAKTIKEFEQEIMDALKTAKNSEVGIPCGSDNLNRALNNLIDRGEVVRSRHYAAKHISYVTFAHAKPKESDNG